MKTKPAIGSQKLAHRVSEAARACGLSRTTIFEHIRNGRIKSVKVGGARLIHDSDLREFLKIEERA